MRHNTNKYQYYIHLTSIFPRPAVVRLLKWFSPKKERQLGGKSPEKELYQECFLEKKGCVIQQMRDY